VPANPFVIPQRAIYPGQRCGRVTLRETGPCHEALDPAARGELPVRLQQDFRLFRSAHVEQEFRMPLDVEIPRLDLGLEERQSECPSLVHVFV
jgi:hypothetical protein